MQITPGSRHTVSQPCLGTSGTGSEIKKGRALMTLPVVGAVPVIRSAASESAEAEEAGQGGPEEVDGAGEGDDGNLT